MNLFMVAFIYWGTVMWSPELGAQQGGTEERGDPDTCRGECPARAAENDVHVDTNENHAGNNNAS